MKSDAPSRSPSAAWARSRPVEFDFEGPVESEDAAIARMAADEGFRAGLRKVAAQAQRWLRSPVGRAAAQTCRVAPRPRTSRRRRAARSGSSTARAATDGDGPEPPGRRSAPLSDAATTPLSLADARQILGARCPVSDVELNSLLESMRDFVAFVFQGYRKQVRAAGAVRNLSEARKLLRDDEAEAVEERAAIMEFDGGVERDRAERGALFECARGRRGKLA